MTKTEYNWSMKRLAILLAGESKAGSAEDLEIMNLARKVEDYEIAHAGEYFGTDDKFEPSIIVDDLEPSLVTQ